MLEMPLECLLVLEGFLESLVAKGFLERQVEKRRACCTAQGHVECRSQAAMLNAHM